MRRYRFRALVKFDPVGHPGPPVRTGIPTAHDCRLLQPFSCHEYFPAVIARDEELPSQPVGHAVVTIALTAGEAEAFFAPGQGFTIWADGVVDHTIRAQGMIGYGVISGPESTPMTSAAVVSATASPPGAPRR